MTPDRVEIVCVYVEHTFSVACFFAGIARILLRLKLRVECWKSSPMIYMSLDRELNSARNRKGMMLSVQFQEG